MLSAGFILSGGRVICGRTRDLGHVFIGRTSVGEFDFLIGGILVHPEAWLACQLSLEEEFVDVDKKGLVYLSNLVVGNSR